MSASSHKPSRPRVRQSIPHVPSRANTTTDVAALTREYENTAGLKRSRGKSLGPGGLEALTESNANTLRVSKATTLIAYRTDLYSPYQ